MYNLRKKYKSIIFFLYAAIIFIIYKNDVIKKLVHPRMYIFIIITGLFLLFLAFYNLKKINIGKIKIVNIVYFVPLIAFLFMNEGNLSNKLIQNKGIDIGTSLIQNLEYDELDNDKKYYDESKQEPEIIIDESDMIIIDDRDFIYIVANIAFDLEQYIGKIVQYTGFVYRDNTIKNNEFVVGRMAMICCSADVSLTGFVGTSEDYKSFKNNKWYKIKAVITKNYYGKNRIPYLKIYEYEEVDKPADEYVY